MFQSAIWGLQLFYSLPLSLLFFLLLSLAAVSQLSQSGPWPALLFRRGSPVSVGEKKEAPVNY